jgi:uncharacterized protein
MIKQLKIEIADTPIKREKGLMNRKVLGENEGMLFKFPAHDNLRFWMKDTYIPLEIAFLNDDEEIIQISEMYPLSHKIISSKEPCKYALEVNKGWFSKNEIKEGASIKGILNKKINKIAQMTPQITESPADINEAPSMGATPELDNEGDNTQEEINPEVQIDFNNKAKVDYAEKNNLAMQIIYLSKQSGQILPPRKLIPVPQEGYPIRSGEGGEYFVAFDSSPTILGGDWEILGNQIKRFLFSNIMTLEIIDEFVE